MKGAGFCSLNCEVHYIEWSLNRVLGVHSNLDIVNKSVIPFLFTISNVICLVNPQNESWILFTICIAKFTISRFVISRFEWWPNSPIAFIYKCVVAILQFLFTNAHFVKSIVMTFQCAALMCLIHILLLATHKSRYFSH